MSNADPSFERHDRVMQILGEALELPTGERAPFVDRACAGDGAMRAEVERFLALEHDADRVIGTASAESVLDRMSVHASQPDQIGTYKISRTLGEGGMGVVYLAEQTEPVRRMVALKLIRGGFVTDSVVARFESERQSLALMNHPNVARVFDAGATPDGRPYFVMEYVPGESITRYADANQLSVTARLELFTQVCDAVQHAHQKGIIHRDIKPTNVLVTLQDGKPVPKVIDFGVAKAVEPDPARRDTLFTLQGQLVGTPEYMSPEQASPMALDVDTRTDVYSLGVLLYEMLSGSLPFESTELRRAGADEMRRIIRESDPPRLTTRLASNAGEAALVAQQRRANPTSLARSLRGDLEWITMKALEKDRARRYGSPAELAADVRRHLSNEPVVAGPPSRIYRIRKFVRRHRLSVAASMLVLLSIAAGTAGVAWQAIRATRAEVRAVEQKDRAEKLFSNVRTLAGSFMFDVDEALQTGGPTKARQLLLNTSLDYLNRLSAESTDDPSILRDLLQGYQRVGYVQHYPGLASLGEPKAALESFRMARDMAQRRLKLVPDDPDATADLLAVSINCADAQRALEDYPGAIKTFDECLSMATEAKRAKPTIWVVDISKAVAHDHKADALRALRRDDEAMQEMRAALELRLALMKDHSDDVRVVRGITISYEGMGSFFADQARYGEALAEFAKAVDVQRDLLRKNSDNPIYRRDVALMLNKIADSHAAIGHVRESREAITEAVREWEKLVEEDPGNARASMDLAEGVKRLGDSLMIGKEYDAALAQFDRCRGMWQRIANENPTGVRPKRDLATTIVAIAEAQRQLGQPQAALVTIGQAMEVYARLGPERSRVDERNQALGYLLAAQIQMKMSDSKSALADFERVIATLESQLKAPEPTRFTLRLATDAMIGAAESCETLGRRSDAIAHFKRAQLELAKFKPPDEKTAAMIARIDARIAELSAASQPSQ